MQTSNRTATAIANPNIAFIKYWGNRDEDLRLPVNGSISMNLDGLFARTTVRFDRQLEQDQFTFNNVPTTGPALERVTRFLNIVREMAGESVCAQVSSENNFPTGAGIASSAAAFAALALAGSRAIGLELSEPELSRLARRGSGSASRSIPAGLR
jgi:diphosphomevalonate decarboxylase